MVSDKCNQNVDANFRPPIDRMSQSVHEARNQIFDDDIIMSSVEQQRKKKRSLNESSTAPLTATSPTTATTTGTAESSAQQIQPQLAFGLDSCFGVLWAFDAMSKSIMCYNVIASEIPVVDGRSYLRAIVSPELALPLRPADVPVTRQQASLNVLACLDILTSGQDSIPGCFEPQLGGGGGGGPSVGSLAAKEAAASSQCQLVSRFENFGGGWGYSGQSVEAIRFMADTDIVLYGFAMFGGRGEYTCKLKLYDLGMDDGGSFEEEDGVLMSETEEIPYECPARSKYNIMLPRPVTAHSGKWYLVWARISGPSSDCGSAGQATVTTEDQIVFTFKSSKKANNGTDVNSGQIPSIMYRVKTHEIKEQTVSVDLDPVYKITRMFANSVTKECFESLVMLLNWAWGTFKMTLHELKDKVS